MTQETAVMTTASPTRQGSGRSLFWPSLVVALLGAGVLYQREGGRIFGSDGLSKLFKPVAEKSARSPVPNNPCPRSVRGSQEVSGFLVRLGPCVQAGSGARGRRRQRGAAIRAGCEIDREEILGHLAPGEEKSLPVPETEGTLEKLHLTGTARSGFEHVVLDVELYSRDQARERPPIEQTGSSIWDASSTTKKGEVRLTPLLEDPASLSHLITAVRDGDSARRAKAARAIGRIGPAAKDAIPALFAAIKDPDELVSRSTIEAVYAVGPAAKDAIPTLVAALKDPNRFVHGIAALALAQIGPEAKDAVPALVTAHSVTRMMSCSAERCHGAGPDRPGGQGGCPRSHRRPQGLECRGPQERRGGRRIGAEAKDAVPALIAALRDTDPEVRRNTAGALGEIGPASKEAVPVLVTVGLGLSMSARGPPRPCALHRPDKGGRPLSSPPSRTPMKRSGRTPPSL